MKPTHGGKRKGAGRKPSGKARTKLQITLPEAMVASMDKRRGDVSRSEWIEARLKRACDRWSESETLHPLMHCKACGQLRGMDHACDVHGRAPNPPAS